MNQLVTYMPFCNYFWTNTSNMLLTLFIFPESHMVKIKCNVSYDVSYLCFFFFFFFLAGHYLPAISSEIIQQNQNATENGLLEINYQSMLIGNGWTNPRTQFKEYATFGCTNFTQCKNLLSVISFTILTWK